MFGYVTINKPELKIKEYSRYKAYYCGLCKTLRQRHGMLGQVTLTYDMTFLIILLTSLYESKTEYKEARCMVHPTKKHSLLQNEISMYAADMNIALAYHNFKDDWMDDHSIKGFAGKSAYHGMYEKVRKQYPRQCDVIQKSLSDLQECEKANSTDLDLVAGHFGTLMAELFVYRKDEWEPELRKIGFYLGKFIYMIDAYEDLDEDMKHDRYNPLREWYHKEDFEEMSQNMLTMMMAECSKEFEKLPLILDVELLRNIVYAGVWSKYDTIRQKKKTDGKEQIV